MRCSCLLNVPAAVVGPLVLLAGRRDRPEPSPREALDLPGACLLGGALLGAVHTLVVTARDGWTAVDACLAVGGAVAAVAFVRHERRAAHPLVPAGLLRAPGIAPALALLVVSSAALFGTLFVGTFFLQDVLGLDPFVCGLRTLPLAATMVFGAPLCAVLLLRAAVRAVRRGRAPPRWRPVCCCCPGWVRTPGPAGSASRSSRWARGSPAVLVTATSVVVGRAPAEQAGVAGGVKQTAMNVGPAAGVALATTLLSFWTPARRSGAGAGFLTAMGPALTVLALLAATGLLLAVHLGSDRGIRGYRRVDSVSRRAQS